jgi:septal ring factor EnvC (AmiA/AmiB activator)
MNAQENPRQNITRQLQVEKLGQQEAAIIDLKSQVILLSNRNNQLTQQLKDAQAKIAELEGAAKPKPESPSPAAPSANEDDRA